MLRRVPEDIGIAEVRGVEVSHRIAGVVCPGSAAIVTEGNVLFLPVFFAFTGLRTRFGLALAGDAWIYSVAILLVAVTGKWLGAMFAARSMGMGAREANALGILLNARGLVELVILSIGFDLGLLSPEVFSMLVLMALVTTLMTAPLVRRMRLHTNL